MKNPLQYLSGSLNRRLQTYLVLFMLVPLISAGIIIFLVSISSVFRLELRSSSQIVTKTADDIDALLYEMIKIPPLINSDMEIQQILRTVYEDSEALAKDMALGDAKVGAINEFRQDIYGIYVVMDNGVTLKSRYFEWDLHAFLRSDLYRKAHNNVYRIWQISEHGSLAVNADNDAVIAVCTGLSNAANNQVSGVCVVEIQAYQMQQMLRTGIGKDGTMFLLNEQNELVAAADDRLPTEKMETYRAITRGNAIGNELVMFDNLNEVLICQRMEHSGWIVVGVVPKGYLKKSGQDIAVTILSVALAFTVIAFAVSRAATRYELLPISLMTAAVRRVEKGDFNVRLPICRPDEIGALTEHFNNMTKRLETLIQQISEEQGNLRKAEFRALQAQITPHFLYNTLDSISGLARMGRTDDVIRIVSALTEFFKTGLSRGRDIITIHEELRHTESYLTIQKMRYSTLFNYRIHIDPGLGDFLIPKLTLQPLVENALYHGIKPCEKNCLLVIHILDIGNAINMEIIDNGVGIEPDRLDALRSEIEKPTGKDSGGFGIINVNERIRSMMGREYGLRFESEPGIGTVVAIQIRKIKEGDNV